MPRDARVDAYIAARAPFAQPILSWLRDRVHAACPDAEEAIKWGMPAFLHRGRPLATMAAFTAHATFGFWDRQALETGQEGTAMGQFGRIENLADLPEAAAMEALLAAAAARIESGARPARARSAPRPELPVPSELSTALMEDPQAEANFRAFPTGQRNEYSGWIDEAKRPATRLARAAQAVEWLREGKRRNWKYEAKGDA